MTAQQAQRLLVQAMQDAMAVHLYNVTIALQQAQEASNTALLCAVWIDGKTTVTSALGVT